MIEIKNKTKAMLQLEEKFNLPFEALLYKLYVVDDMKQEDMSKFLNIPRKTLIIWLRKAKIHSHKLKSLEKYLDENNCE